MVASAIEAAVKVPPPRSRRARWLAATVVAGLAVVYLAAITSTHAALSGGFVGWSGVLPVNSSSLTSPTAAEYASIFPTSQGYGEVLWATRPGGEVTFGFSVHNGGPVPVTLLGVALRTFDPGVVNALAPAGAQLGPGFGQMKPFHSVALGPGDTVWTGLTERVVCDPTIRSDARALSTMRQPDTAFIGDATSPVVVRYRVLGVTMSQTLSIAEPKWRTPRAPGQSQTAAACPYPPPASGTASGCLAAHHAAWPGPPSARPRPPHRAIYPPCPAHAWFSRRLTQHQSAAAAKAANASSNGDALPETSVHQIG